MTHPNRPREQSWPDHFELEGPLIVGRTPEEGDVLVVWRLDRLGRSLKHLIELVTELEQAGIGFQSLQEHIDTTSPGGKLVFHIFGALAKFERNLIQERTKAGLEGRKAQETLCPAAGLGA